MSQNRRGFTLIELMIVVVIIGILAAIAIPNYMAMQVRSKENSVKSNAHSVQLAVEDYAVQYNGVFPSLGQVQTRFMIKGWNEFTNPFTGAPETVKGLGWERGRVGYGISGSVYMIEGYGDTDTSGPYGNGVIITLTNG